MWKIYTKTGDSGTTSLVGGERVKKNNIRVEAYGALDELMSHIGAIYSDKGCDDEVKGQLIAVQRKLFDIGGYLATPVKEGPQPAVAHTSDKASQPADSFAPNDAAAMPQPKNLSPGDILKLEGWLDALNEQTPEINSFVLPGGCELSAKAHVARTVCRRAERCVISLAEAEYVAPIVISYLNRLSDYLFVLARYFNFISGNPDIPYK